MTAFLLVISLLLNGVAIFSIFILYARQNRLVEVEKSQERMMKEMEEIISSYLIEMKEENEAFISRFQQMNPASFPERVLSNVPPNSPSINKTTPAINLDGVDAEEKDWSEKAGKAFKKQAVKAYQNTAVNKAESPVNSELSLKEETETNTAEKQPESKKPEMADEEIYRDLFLDQVRLLQKRGYSIDDIAKKLNKGRTEIELLLKFG